MDGNFLSTYTIINLCMLVEDDSLIVKLERERNFRLIIRPQHDLISKCIATLNAYYAFPIIVLLMLASLTVSVTSS